MLKEAGLYIEEAKTVELPFGNSKEVMPPPGWETGRYWQLNPQKGTHRFSHGSQLQVVKPVDFGVPRHPSAEPW